MVGAWISSKIHVYHENRKAHLEDLKQKILIPLAERLIEQYASVVLHRVPVVADKWGIWHRRENASVTEYPTEQGPVLLRATPDVIASLDEALFADARKTHFYGLIQKTEVFLARWDAHANECYAWVETIGRRDSCGE